MDRHVTLTLPEELHARLAREAERRQVTPAEVIERALEALLAAPPDQEERPIWEELLELADQVPDEEFARMPNDASEEHDHYIYGTPKRSGRR